MFQLVLRHRPYADKAIIGHAVALGSLAVPSPNSRTGILTLHERLGQHFEHAV